MVDNAVPSGCNENPPEARMKKSFEEQSFASMGRVLRACRLRCNLTQRDIADQIGKLLGENVDTSSITKFEGGDSCVSTLRLMAYCAVVGIPPQKVVELAADEAKMHDPESPGATVLTRLARGLMKIEKKK